MTLATLLALAATCTLPTFRADTSLTGRVLCAAGPARVTDLAYVRVHASRQSPTWLAKRDSMLAFAASWAKYWPAVRAEAAPSMVTRTAVSRTLAGTRYTFTPAIPWATRPAFVYVTTENDSGRVSCRSNVMALASADTVAPGVVFDLSSGGK